MKKLLGMTFVALFMMSMTNAKVNLSEVTVVESDKDCLDQVNIFYSQAQNSGNYNEVQLDLWYNMALAVYCHGYTWEAVLIA